MGGFDAKTILKNGWGQGSVFGEELREKYCPGWDVVVVISHDCDVAHHKLEGEPKVEVICGQRVQTLEKMKTQGRHPRELHFEISGAKYSISIHDRDFLSREILMVRAKLVLWRVFPSNPAAFLELRIDREGAKVVCLCALADHQEVDVFVGVVDEGVGDARTRWKAYRVAFLELV